MPIHSLTHEALNPKTENIAIFTQKSIYLEKMMGKMGQSPHTLKGGRKKTEIAIFRQKSSSKLPKYTENPKKFIVLSDL